MANDRLPTEFWVTAQLRRFSSAGASAYLIRRGDAERGTVIVRLVCSKGVRVLTQIRDMEGRLAWMGVKEGAMLPPAEADAYIDRAITRDFDVWVIEIEAGESENPFEGRVVGL